MPLVRNNPRNGKVGHIMSELEATEICLHCKHEKLWHSLSSSHWMPPASTNCLRIGNCKCPGFEAQ